MERIDFVITWVDGSDENWLREKAQYKYGGSDVAVDKEWNDSEIRYRDWDVLKYWFRGVEQNAPWVGKIHFVTWGHLPEWLNTEHPKLNIVKHSDFIPEKYLPTFNSNAIEFNLHRIKGLSDRFVYFNDDMYLIDCAEQTDFFKNGLPCETATLDCIPLEWDISHSEIKNIQLINKYFSKKQVLKKHWRKWFTPLYGVQLVKTFLLWPWERFPGMYEGHITSAYLKKTFETLWEKEPEALDKTCACRFRDENNLNHWVCKNWQLATGEFTPRSPGIGKMFFKKIDDEILSAITKKRYKILCINDFECSQEEFLEQKRALGAAFETIFPNKSQFEK